MFEKYFITKYYGMDFRFSGNIGNIESDTPDTRYSVYAY